MLRWLRSLRCFRPFVPIRGGLTGPSPRAHAVCGVNSLASCEGWFCPWVTFGCSPALWSCSWAWPHWKPCGLRSWHHPCPRSRLALHWLPPMAQSPLSNESCLPAAFCSACCLRDTSLVLTSFSGRGAVMLSNAVVFLFLLSSRSPNQHLSR